jgi:demethylmenaquinone methyltransferase / 2-methoxy-6-polyprenyl-1,4-benzoquinol methylase
MARLVAEIDARHAEAQEGHALAVRAMFDRISPTYDLLNRTLSWGIDRRWRVRALRALARDLPEGALLDLCAGTLDLAQAMRGRWQDRPIVGADFARDMLRRGRDKLAGQALLAVADAQQLPFASESFAGVVCGFGMRNLADPTRGMAEVRRVLKPGGGFVVLEFFRPTRWSTRLFHAFYGNLLLPTVGRLVSGDAEAYAYLSRSMQGFATRDEFVASLREVGFRHVESSDLTFGIASIVRGVR